MSNVIVTLLFDCLLAGLLIATISYCAKLSRRIKLLQDSKGELAEMITQFDTATERAMSSLAELQTVSKKITDALQLKIEKANFLADDLAFLIEKSTKLTVQLEQAKAPPAAPTKTTFEPKALFGAAKSQSTNSSIEAALNRLASSASAEPKIFQSSDSSQVRTNAERELIEALKSGRG
jgi:hypothetical protein